MIFFNREENAVAANPDWINFKLLARFMPLEDLVLMLTKPKTQLVKIVDQINQPIELDISNQE